MPRHQRTLRCRQTAKEKGFTETSITTEEQGEEENEYFECLDEKNILEDKKKVLLESGSIEELRDEREHKKQGEEEGVNFKNEYVEELNEKDVLEDKETLVFNDLDLSGLNILRNFLDVVSSVKHLGELGNLPQSQLRSDHVQSWLAGWLLF